MAVNRDYYVTDAWHALAAREQVEADVADRLPENQQSALAAFSTGPSRKRKVNAARREATAQDRRQFAKQFEAAKKAEIKSWEEKRCL